MREHRITLPELALIAGTRGMIGFGVGLLISDRLRSDQRRAVGLTLLVTGALSTIPLGLMLFRGRRRDPVREGTESKGSVAERGHTENPVAMMAD